MVIRSRPSPDDPAEAILDALLSGRLGAEHLTARDLSAFLGKTTGHVYHRWGSLDALLFDVVQAGFRYLARRLASARDRGSDLADVAVAFVDFGLEQPTLYGLMFERRYDWAELRARGLLGPALPGLALWTAVTGHIGHEEARLLYAGLHGLVSLAASGRANVGVIAKPDHDVARDSARRLARLLCPSDPEPPTDKPHDKPRRPARKRSAPTPQPNRQERHERAPRRPGRRPD